ncbi:MAG TPA: dihydrolipoyl dehydrogenase [Deltaproteobacteria bacterium]|jgi:dihydrolipoamide dehydrogenase|nr:dihydrolipoyl dehydrogenase [Deltaproteobacteria bacterium]HOI05920.1 dihydrolipoyl dehydrogenase [Deltaproteobacteria bacterium]
MTTTTEPYDVFVIGAGPGGYSAAILAAKKGLRTGIAEGSAFGGTCTNTGCIPAKTYIESVNLLAKMAGAAKYGIEAPHPKIDFAKVKSRKDRIVKRLAKGIDFLLKHHGIDVFHHDASVPEPGSVQVGDTLLRTRNTIVATGARPRGLPVLNGSGFWTSDEVFDVTELPGSLAIIGAGGVGMEMAHIFSSLGVNVTLIEALDRILPGESRHVSEYMAKIYHKVRILTSARVTGVEGTGPCRLTVETPSGPRSVEADRILVSIGRRPVIPEGLAELGIRLTETGGIRTDEFMRTSIDGIYAAGDVTGDYMYAYVASREASVAVDHIAGGTAWMSYRNIPTVVFTNPEVASVGTLPDKHEPTDCRIGTFPVSALGRARTMEANDGYARITADRDGRLLKVSIVAPHASELITWAALAIDHGLTVEGFLGSYCPHPVLGEIVKEAAEDILKRSVHHP